MCDCRHRHLLLVMLAFAGPSVIARQSDWEVTFNKAWEDAQAAEQEKRWADAERLYARVAELIPGEPATQVARAKCLVRLDRIDEAVACLSTAVEGGWTRVAELRENEAFKGVSDTDRDRLSRRMEQVKAERILVYIPKGLDPDRPAPLIVAFHGRGENPHLFLPSWHEAADRLGAIVVAPRGVHERGEGMLHMWEAPSKQGADIDVPACETVMDEAIRLASTRGKIDERRIIVTGYSQGGAVALRMLADHPERFAGAFARAALYPANTEAFRTKRDGQPTPPIYLLSGERDRLKHNSDSLYADLTTSGWPVHFETVPAVGHEPPPDNPRRQVDAIRFVLDKVRD